MEAEVIPSVLRTGEDREDSFHCRHARTDAGGGFGLFGMRRQTLEPLRETFLPATTPFTSAL